MPDEEDVREKLKEAIDDGQVELVMAPKDATFQKLWDHFNRWTSAVCIADIAYRRGASKAPGNPKKQRQLSEAFVENLIKDWAKWAQKELGNELQERIEKYGLKQEVITQMDAHNQAEIQEVSNSLRITIKNALKRMRGD